MGSLDMGVAPVFVPAPDPTPRTAAALTQSEQEIARLTWLVLDGKASQADRRRLAELVAAQHARRYPPSR